MVTSRLQPFHGCPLATDTPPPMTVAILWTASTATSAPVSYGPPWAHYLGGYQDRLLGGSLGLLVLRCTAPDGVKHKDYRGEVLG
jgi:hypothetical protein